MIAWLLSLLLAMAPPGRVPARENAEVGEARYAAIAADVAAVLAEEPPLFGGSRGRALTAALVLSVAFHESGFRADVDSGATRGGGVDTCIMQIRPRSREEADALLDRRVCIRTGLRLMRRSLLACRARPLEERLAAYASGTCDRGLVESRAMVEPARKWLREHPPAQSAREK